MEANLRPALAVAVSALLRGEQQVGLGAADGIVELFGHLHQPLNAPLAEHETAPFAPAPRMVLCGKSVR